MLLEGSYTRGLAGMTQRVSPYFWRPKPKIDAGAA